MENNDNILRDKVKKAMNKHFGCSRCCHFRECQWGIGYGKSVEVEVDPDVCGGDDFADGYLHGYIDCYEDMTESTNPPDNFLGRLKIEEKDLSEKIGKLKAFLASPKSETASAEQKRLLRLQLEAMELYHSFLLLRLEDLSSSKE